MPRTHTEVPGVGQEAEKRGNWEPKALLWFPGKA